jgi:hypothetical protein
MMANSKLVAYGCLAVLIALYVVGAVSVPPGSLRHEVQTLPLWFPIVAGFQRRESAKWAALPCLMFWLSVMILIWLFLLGWARGAGAIVGLLAGARWRTTVQPLMAFGIFVLFGALQFLAFRISLSPYIAHRQSCPRWQNSRNASAKRMPFAIRSASAFVKSPLITAAAC